MIVMIFCQVPKERALVVPVTDISFHPG